jgi:ribosomal protein L15E
LSESGSDWKGHKEEEIAQLMWEVDLVKWSSHSGIAKYEEVARDENACPTGYLKLYNFVVPSPDWRRQPHILRVSPSAL